MPQQEGSAEKAAAEALLSALHAAIDTAPSAMSNSEVPAYARLSTAGLSPSLGIDVEVDGSVLRVKRYDGAVPRDPNTDITVQCPLVSHRERCGAT